jgi:hypothetical protein
VASRRAVLLARETERPLRPYEREDLEIAVSIITVAELEMGVLAAVETRIRAARLRTLLRVLAARGGELERQMSFGIARQLFERELAALCPSDLEASRRHRPSRRPWCPPRPRRRLAIEGDLRRLAAGRQLTLRWPSLSARERLIVGRLALPRAPVSPRAPLSGEPHENRRRL